MPRRMQVVVFVNCEMCGADCDPEIKTTVLTINGKTVELDLCERDAAKFEKAVMPFFQNGRRPSKTTAAVKTSATEKRSSNPGSRQDGIKRNCSKGCGYINYSPQGVAVHEKHCDGRPLEQQWAIVLECPECGQQYNSKSNFRVHRESTHGVVAVGSSAA